MAQGRHMVRSSRTGSRAVPRLPNGDLVVVAGGGRCKGRPCTAADFIIFDACPVSILKAEEATLRAGEAPRWGVVPPSLRAPFLPRAPRWQSPPDKPTAVRLPAGPADNQALCSALRDQVTKQ